MANSLRDISLFAKAVVGSEPWLRDPKCVPMPWRSPAPVDGPLVIGILRNDGVVRPTPPVARALDETAEALRKAGHEVVEWEVEGDEFEVGVKFLYSFFYADGRQVITDLLLAGGEAVDSVPGLPSPRPALNVAQTWEAQGARTKWAAKILEHWARLKGPKSGRSIDALLAPATPYAAVAHDTFAWVGYTGVWNNVDAPSVVLPITRADKEKDEWKLDDKPWSDPEKAVRDTCECGRSNHPIHSAADTSSNPSLQIQTTPSLFMVLQLHFSWSDVDCRRRHCSRSQRRLTRLSTPSKKSRPTNRRKDDVKVDSIARAENFA